MEEFTGDMLHRNHAIVKSCADALRTREMVKQHCRDMKQLYPWP